MMVTVIPCLPIGLFGFAWTTLGPPNVHWIAPMIFTMVIGIANVSSSIRNAENFLMPYSILSINLPLTTPLLHTENMQHLLQEATTSHATFLRESQQCIPHQCSRTSVANIRTHMRPQFWLASLFLLLRLSTSSTAKVLKFVSGHHLQRK